MAVVGLNITYEIFRRTIMSKERRSHREDKKKPAMSPKEKKAAKKSRKESRDLLGEHGVR
jgi:preprotein translocase subunit Sec63